MVEIPKIPAYCSHCNALGHEIIQCRGLIKAIQEPNKQHEDREEQFQVVNRQRNNNGRRGNLHGREVMEYIKRRTQLATISMVRRDVE